MKKQNAFIHFTILTLTPLISLGEIQPLPQKSISTPENCLQISAIASQKPTEVNDTTKYPVDTILVSKSLKRLFVISKNTVLFSFKTAFGSGYSEGAKSQEGDNRTPEGTYKIDFKKENSDFYRALKISYPSLADKQFAQQHKVSPGGDIMIHGLSNKIGSLANIETVGNIVNSQNWTQGCIAIRNDQIELLYKMVKVNTNVEICPLAE
jgi:murein L,D-transpeptidase YafK